MIIKVDKQEKDVLEYVCATYGFKCRVFTMENNPNLVQVEVFHDDGGELDAEMSWLLCKSVNARLERV